MKSSGTHSSSNSAGPQENEAADTRLCVMLPHCSSRIFLKTIKLSERTQITEVPGTEATLLHPWHNPSGEQWFDWRARADSWEGNKKGAISIISEFLLPDGICWLLCSSSAWQSTRNPQGNSCLLHILLPATCYKTPRKEPAAICVQHLCIWKGCAKEMPA